ncbi:hypothetical protein BJX76DRAFT_99189 [Aspergillus varians]
MAIAAKAAECAQHLERVAQATTSEEARQEWENQIFRFNLWSQNNFVFAPTRASMDWRLRNAAVLESSLCEILDELQSILIRHSAIMKAAGIQQKEDQHGAVNEALSELFRLSRAFRRSGILRRFVKIGSYIEYDENGVNLTEEFRKGVERVVEYRLKDSSAGNNLQRRVVDTICLRQQHFAYLRAKWEKGKIKPQENVPTPMVPKSTLGATFSVIGSISSTGKATRRKKTVAPPVAVQSVMTATTAQPERAKRVRSIKSTASIEHQEVECNQDDLPLPPKVPLHALEHECPFCYMVCSSADFSGDRWKKHVVQDIMPFICILDACRTPNALYESGRDWLKHMRTEHMVCGWTCMDDGHKETMFFNSATLFKEHMFSCHEGAFLEDELDGIANASYQRLPIDIVITVCPFCPTDHAINIPPEKMIAHVAEHLMSFAQISITWQMSGPDSASYAESSSGRPDPFDLDDLPRQRGRRYVYHGLDDLEKERLAERRGRRRYLWYGDNLPVERRQGDFPAWSDEEYATDPEYLQEGLEPFDVDEDICKALWQNVRQKLNLPPLDHEPPESLRAFQARATEDTFARAR